MPSSSARWRGREGRARRAVDCVARAKKKVSAGVARDIESRLVGKEGLDVVCW